MAAQRLDQSGDHRPGGRPGDHLRAHHEPGMVIDAGDQLHLPAIPQIRAAHHIHLPQLHRPAALPPPVILPAPLAFTRLHQPMAYQRPIHTRAARHRLHLVAGQLPADPIRAPRRMRPAHRHHHRLDPRRHLMRAGVRARRTVDQPAQPTLIGIAAQPLVHRLPTHPVTARDLHHETRVSSMNRRSTQAIHRWFGRRRPATTTEGASSDEETPRSEGVRRQGLEPRTRGLRDSGGPSDPMSPGAG